MQELSVVVANKSGLHARPAKNFVSLAKQFESRIRIIVGERTADAKSVLSVMSLGAVKGTPLSIIAEGRDESEAICALDKLFKDNLYEE